MFETVLKDTQRVKSVSGAAALEYEKKQNDLRQYIDQHLLVHENLGQILGSNPAQILLDNHMYHARFMSNVFQLNSYENPFPRDPAVVAELERDGMLQAAAPLPGREDELERIRTRYGLPRNGML